LVDIITYIKVVKGRIMIPRQGMIHEPPKTRSKAIGRASHAKMRNILEKPTANAVKHPPLLCCLIFFSFFYELVDRANSL
jgi:hypothetical protein